MGKRRFQLRADQTAQENLWRAVHAACVVVCSRYSWYGLCGDSRHELLEEMELAGYRHFIKFKVMRHGYCRQTEDGKSLTFFDNVLSSCWSMSRGVSDRYIRKVVDVRAKTLYLDSPVQDDIEDCGLLDTITSADKVYYLPSSGGRRKTVPYDQQTPRQRANTIREEYAEHRLDCEDLGIYSMPMDKWLETTGYAEDKDAMWYFKSREDRKAIRLAKKKAERLNRAVERKKKRQLDKDLQKSLPHGWKFVQVNGIICITRSNDE